MRFNRLMSLILLIGIIGSAKCVIKSYVQQIHKDIFSNYTKGVLPVIDHTKPLKIGIKFYLSVIHKFSEIDETMTVTGSFSLNWTDALLTWDPTLYGDVYVTIVDASDMWTPPLILANTAHKMETVGSDSKFQAMLVYNGEVFYSVGDLFEAKCEVDISNFPFDEQQCTLMFMAWGVPPDYLDFSSISEKADLQYFYPNADWTLVDHSTQVVKLEYTVWYNVNLKIKRSSLYYGVMVIAPTILFAVMNPLVFLLPVESGERVGLAMTILLSYAIFLTIVSSSIPASSNPMCLLLIVMVVVIFISGIIVFGVILSLKYFSEEDPDKITNCLRCLARRFSRKNKEKTYTEHNVKNVSGKDVSGLLDSIFFYGSYFVMIATIAGFVIYTATTH